MQMSKVAQLLITLKDNNKFIFKGTSKISNELPITNIGDNVTITYTKTDATTINITKFINNSILDKSSNKDKEDNSTQESKDNKENSSTKN